MPLKTQKNDTDVRVYIDQVSDEQLRQDAHTILDLMEQITESKPRMWGSALIGLGDYHYRYDSGREGDWFKIGFAPRKTNISLYLLQLDDEAKDMIARLGKYKAGKSCIYIKSLSDVDLEVLKQLIALSWQRMTTKYG